MVNSKQNGKRTLF